MTTESTWKLNRAVFGIAALMALAPLAYLTLTYESWPTLGDGAAAELPPPNRSELLGMIAESGSFDTFERLIETAGLEALGSGEEAITVLAPTDEAFGRLSDARIEAALATEASAEALLSRHVLAGRYPAEDLLQASGAQDLQGDTVPISAGESVKIRDAEVASLNLIAGRDVLHALDAVIPTD